MLRVFFRAVLVLIANCTVLLVQGTLHNKQLSDDNVPSRPCYGNTAVTFRVPDVNITVNGAVLMDATTISGMQC